LQTSRDADASRFSARHFRAFVGASFREAGRMTISQYLDAHAGDLAQLLGDLVRVPTVNPPGENYAAITTRLTRE
jgi:hypothetical protein